MKVYDLFGENRPAWRSPGGRCGSRRAGSSRRCRTPARRQPRCWPGWSSPSRGRSSRSTGPPGARSSWRPPRRTTSSSRWPMRWASTTSIATRYATAPDGRYDGTFDGEFVWGPGKLRAISAWAAERDIDLAQSYAYSDSFYDLPMLSAVGHPVVVNPDPRLVVMALLRRWPIVHLDVPSGVPKIPVVGIEPQRAAPGPRAARSCSRTPASTSPASSTSPRTARPSWSATTAATSTPWPWPWRWPSGADPCASSARRRCSTPPSSGRSPAAMGGIRVERASGSDEPLAAAAAALVGGEVVALMPAGHDPAGQGVLRNRRLKGRWGAARLAAMTGAPVIPVGLWGTEKVWPRSERLPNLLALGHPPTITISIGPAVEGLTGESPDADTKRIMKAIVAQLPRKPARSTHRPPRSYGDVPAGLQGRPRGRGHPETRHRLTRRGASRAAWPG